MHLPEFGRARYPGNALQRQSAPDQHPAFPDASSCGSEPLPTPGEKPGFLGRHPEAAILYLLLITGVSMFVHAPRASIALLVLQFVLWAPFGFRRRDLRMLRKSIPFSMALLLINTFFQDSRDWLVFSLGARDIYGSWKGFIDGGLMIVRLWTIMAASTVVRLAIPPGAFVRGLMKLRVSENFAQVLDSILAAMEEQDRHGDSGEPGSGRGGGHGGGGGRGAGKGKRGESGFRLRDILRGDFQFLIRMFEDRIRESKARFADHDWAIISAVSVVIVSLRLVRILPGIPFAPGYKNAIFIPLFVITARLTNMRFAATLVGLFSGILNFMFGYGRFGVLGILQFMVPGLVVDLLSSLNKTSQSLLWLGFIGIGAGIARVAAEVLLAMAFGLPSAFYLFYSPFIVTQCAFGAVSAPISRYMVRTIKG